MTGSQPTGGHPIFDIQTFVRAGATLHLRTIQIAIPILQDDQSRQWCSMHVGFGLIDEPSDC